MANMKRWKGKKDIDAERQEREKKRQQKQRFKEKDFKSLSSKEKDELLEQIATDLRYINED
ncbi:hypothetical protein J2S78_002044 [Salibacterium salarium]|uniref:hypothetical protein n=1 Tax=Salibacterium salarium TaxID=284579 RepID=UPI002781E545|nr:hypothetical protein [Salibacterium salarium]MDQ0299624.1 hypothetical protein [Salibacterium salarium]